MTARGVTAPGAPRRRRRRPPAEDEPGGRPGGAGLPEVPEHRARGTARHPRPGGRAPGRRTHRHRPPDRSPPPPAAPPPLRYRGPRGAGGVEAVPAGRRRHPARRRPRHRPDPLRPRPRPPANAPRPPRRTGRPGPAGRPGRRDGLPLRYSRRHQSHDRTTSRSGVPARGEETMKILFVGRGTVSTLYGWAFAKAGHDVAFLVRPGMSHELTGEVDLDLLDARAESVGVPILERFEARCVESAAAASDFDLVFLGVRPEQMREGAEQLAKSSLPRLGVVFFNNYWGEPGELTNLFEPGKALWAFPLAGGAYAGKRKLVGAIQGKI